MSNKIKKSLDNTLSSLYVSQQEADNLLMLAKGRKKMKRKLSVALVLTIVIILITLGAIAAVLLSMRDLVEQEMVPLANQTPGETLSIESTTKVLQLAEQNGIELSESAREQIQKALDQGEGYFKWEMLMALAKADFGQQPQTWTLEQQNWFSQVTVALGLFEQEEKAMPEGGEDAKFPIIQAAKDYIRKKHDSNAPLDDPGKYQIGVQYINGDADGDYPGMYWSVDFQSQYLEGAEYWIYLRDDRSVFDEWVRPGLKENAPIEEIRSRFTDHFGWQMSTWSPAMLRSFKRAIALSSSTNDQAFLAIKQTDYPDVSEDAITKETASENAAKALHLTSYELMNAVFIDDKPHAVWKVCLYVQHIEDVENSADPFSAYSYYYVEVDSITGEVKSIYTRNNRYDRWYLDIVLQRVIDDVEVNWVDDTKSVG